jgi:hypothetical protein
MTGTDDDGLTGPVLGFTELVGGAGQENSIAC